MNKITSMINKGGLIIAGLCLALVLVAGYAWKVQDNDASVSAPEDILPTATASLTGFVVYKERVALAPGSQVVVELKDVTNPESTFVVADVAVPTEGKSIPISFSLDYDPTLIAEDKSYSLSVQIMEGETLRFVSFQPYPVLTKGGQVNEVTIMVSPPGVAPTSVSPDPAPVRTGVELSGTAWVWQYTDGDTLVSPERILAPSGEKFVLSFETDTFQSTTDCNQLSGGYIQTGEIVSLGPIVSTKMACVEETLEATYADQLGRVSSYTVVNGELRMNLQRDTGVMVFTKRVNEIKEEDLVFCTEEAMECPDGSFVGRSGPRCEFSTCPGV